MQKKRKNLSIKEYFQKVAHDEKERKAFLVGVVVFLIVFVGLTIYGREAGKRQGDVILTNGGTAVEQGAADADGGDALGSEAADADGGGSVMRSGAKTETDGEGTDGNAGNKAGDNTAGGASGASTEGIDGNAGDKNTAGDASGQSAIFVDVGGAVNISGLFALPAGSRVADAIEAAGGLTDEANVKFINRAAILNDGDRLYVPTEAEVRNGTAPPTAGQVTSNGGYMGGSGSVSGGSESNKSETGNAGSPGQGLINLNTADSEELQKLNGVGPVTAQKIIDYRTKRGGFNKIEDLMNVSGIGAKTFEKLKDYITV